MALSNFDGETFVAFIDISGFKKLMQKNQAKNALDLFYKTGYNLIKDQQSTHKIEGLFISDCGILFVNNLNDEPNLVQDLTSLLQMINTINRRMLNENFMLVSSIAYGKFKYQNRFEIQNIEKNAIYGDAYVDVVTDIEGNYRKIEPGECRLIAKSLPPDIKEIIENQSADMFNLVKRKKNRDNYYYYYWMCETENDIERINRDYHKSTDAKYDIILKSLKQGRNSARYKV
jgi:hypothetical protein